MTDICMKNISQTLNHTFPKNLWEWSLSIFVIGFMTLEFIEGLSVFVILYGIFFSWMFSMYFLKEKLTLQPEIILFFTWIIWALTGLFHVSDLFQYKLALKTISQIAVMIFVIAGITALRRNLTIVMVAIVIGGTFMLLYSYYTGNLELSREIGSNERLKGIASNANEFAYPLLFVVFASFFLWEFKSSLLWRASLSIALSTSVIGIIYSGSRKAFLAVMIFMILWFMFCKFRRFFKNPVKIMFLFIILSTALFLTMNYVISETAIGKRFSTDDGVSHSDQKRMQMYEEGFDIISKNPIFGIGLNNYRVVTSFGTYSHSEYIEVAANTGLVGFVLYFSIYIVLWRRLNRIRHLSDDDKILYVVGFLKAAIITILFVALGKPNISSKVTWLFLASAIGYSWSVEQVLLSKFYTKQP